MFVNSSGVCVLYKDFFHGYPKLFQRLVSVVNLFWFLLYFVKKYGDQKHKLPCKSSSRFFANQLVKILFKCTFALLLHFTNLF